MSGSIPGGRGLLDGGNALKLGLFGFNCSNGLSLTLADTTYEATWDHTLAIARRADEMGLEVLIPIARWRGLGGQSDAFGTSFETMTWAAGLAAATQHSTIVSTLHLPMTHPVVAAKQCATIDHIAHGRYAFNAVMGWYAPDMKMFGSEMREHDERYRFGAEWIEIVKRLWTETEPFDHHGEYFQLTELQAQPKPWQEPYPLLINAGNSPAGMDYAAAHADVNFVHVEELEKGRAYMEGARAHARDTYGRDLRFYGIGFVICRETEEEAVAVRKRMIDEADTGAVENYLREYGIGSQSLSEDFIKQQADKGTVGMGAYQLVGTPEQVADGLADLSSIGLDGVCLAFLDYHEELPYFGEQVLPLLERRGLRTPFVREAVPA
jgi:alkanesulfonate monooxygenase SsuD/methylene tetrahydromethanopterin reductase-like flavin-dependent oxidoreductase (luciferase family)